MINFKIPNCTCSLKEEISYFEECEIYNCTCNEVCIFINKFNNMIDAITIDNSGDFFSEYSYVNFSLFG